MKKSSKEPIEAPDAIPEEGILLVDAYQCLLASIWEHPERVQKFDGYWAEILEESEKELTKVRKVSEDNHGYDVEIEEAEEIVRASMTANLCLRLALEEKELAAYVRDPRFDRILRLSSKGWTEDLGVPVPEGIWSNYVRKGDGAHPAPRGTLIDGELQPIFLKVKDFNKWLASIFSDESKNEVVVRKKRGPEQARIRYIANILWPGQTLPPEDKSSKECLAAMNAWCKEQNCRPIIERTYWRFLEKQESTTAPDKS